MLEEYKNKVQEELKKKDLPEEKAKAVAEKLEAVKAAFELVKKNP